MKGPPTFFVFLSPLPGMTSLIFGGPNFVRISDSTGILKKFRDLPGKEILQFIDLDMNAEKR